MKDILRISFKIFLILFIGFAWFFTGATLGIILKTGITSFVTLISSPIVLYIAMHILIIKKETIHNNIAVGSLIMSFLSAIILIVFTLINNCIAEKVLLCQAFDPLYLLLMLIELASFGLSVILISQSLILIIRNKDYKNAIYPILAFLILIAIIYFYRYCMEDKTLILPPFCPLITVIQ
jgi:hypothetical protein